MKSQWPDIEYEKWQPTYQTLHRWIQIVGKIRLCLSPWLNHSWTSTFYVTSRGLTTSAIPLEEKSLTIDFDFHDHELLFQDSKGLNFVIPLKNYSVSTFYESVMEALKFFEVSAPFYPCPNELEDATPFINDHVHHTYNPVHVHEAFQALVRINNVFQEYRANFIGKSSPVHLFWGSFDLAVTRFSGKIAPKHPGGIPHLPNSVVQEAYSHEVISCGFWFGNNSYPRPAFYGYAYPQPIHLENIWVPEGAYFNSTLQEFILDYDIVRMNKNPGQLIKEFFEAVYAGASELSDWDREALEESKYMEFIRHPSIPSSEHHASN